MDEGGGTRVTTDMKKTIALFSFVAVLLLAFAASAQPIIVAAPEHNASTSSALLQRSPRAAENSNGVSLVVWVENNQSVMARRVDVNGEPAGAAFLVATSPGLASLGVGSNGLSFLVVYGAQQLLGQYVNADGTLRGTPFVVSGTTSPGAEVSVVWTGLKYFVAWSDIFAAHVGVGVEYDGRYVDQRDATVSPGFVIESRSSATSAAVLECDFAANGARRVLAVCRDDKGVFGDVVVDVDDRIGPLFIAGSTARMPRAAWSGAQWVVGWLEGSKLKRALVTDTVNFVNDTPMETGITSASGSYRLAPAPDGILYAGGDNAVYAAQLDYQGRVIVQPTLLASNTQSRIALAGSLSLITASATPIAAYTNAQGKVVFRTLRDVPHPARRHIAGR
jgi:hypothetical protein